MKLSRLITICAVSVFSACSPRLGRVVPTAAPERSDKSYLDLAAGGRLRIVVPLLKAGATEVTSEFRTEKEGTIELSASNLIGYEIYSYEIEGHRRGEVSLRYIAAQITKDQKTIPEINAPKLPFVMPGKTQHIRLIYYVRRSQLDHNMAIAASKDMAALNAFTLQFERDPGSCGTARSVTCVWVPAGVAVRPE